MGHVTAISGFDRALRLAGALAMTFALGGCGGVEFEGKVFDYVGLSGDRQQADVHMTDRPPLLLPPDTKRLPPPGQGGMATARQDWPSDPERVRKQVAAEKKAKVDEAKAKADPLNAYAGKPTLLDKWFTRSKDQVEPIADVPEPDPSAAPPPQDGTTSAQRGLKPHQADTPVQHDTFKTTPAAPDSYTNPASIY